jgi:hypothetical protein
MLNTLRYFLLVCLFGGFALLNWYCSSKNIQHWSNKGVYASLSDSAKYVGMQTCSGCHQGVHATFIHTGMGKSFDKASKTKSAGKYDNHPVVYDKFRDFFYSPKWEGDSLRFLEFRLAGKDTIFKRVETVDYIVGSGQHTNSHMWTSNGYFFQAPLTYYVQKGIWDLPPGFENGNNTRFSRQIGLECMSCHNGYPEFKLGSENKYNLVKDGIDCERCHGPGSIHVQEKTAGILIDTAVAVDYSIVNPSKLSMELQFDVCQRCHIQGNSVLKEGKSYFDFKPGMALSDVMDVYMPVYEGRPDEHIMASHAERLKQSKCYLVSTKRIDSKAGAKQLKPYKNGLTCITCHNPHVSVKQTNPEVFNDACKSCHQASKDPLCKESIANQNLKKNDCVSCHMPFNGATDIPHVSVHDHKIAVKPAAKEIGGTKKLIGITSINNSNPTALSKAQAYINYVEKFGYEKKYLDSAMYYLSKSDPLFKSKYVSQLVQIGFLKNDFESIIQITESTTAISQLLNKQEYSNANGWTAYRIGEAYSQVGNPAKALTFYKLAYELTPYSAEFANKYGTVLVSNQRIMEAKNIFAGLVKEHPEYAPGYSNYGFIVLNTEQDQYKAMEFYNKALLLDPDYIQALINKAGLLIYQQEVNDAKTILKSILKKDPQNVQVKAILSKINTLN